MRRKMLLFIYSVILCTSVFSCGIAKTDENNRIESETEENTVGDVTETGNIISPLPVTIDINNLDDCTVAVV